MQHFRRNLTYLADDGQLINRRSLSHDVPWHRVINQYSVCASFRINLNFYIRPSIWFPFLGVFLDGIQCRSDTVQLFKDSFYLVLQLQETYEL